MNWYRALALSLLAVAASACAGGSSATSDGPVRTRGVIVTVGGPPPGAPRPIAGAEFRVHGAGASAQVHADAHGRFGFDVAPGTYAVTITGHAPMSGNAFIRPRHGTIAVRLGNRPIRIVVDIR